MLIHFAPFLGVAIEVARHSIAQKCHQTNAPRQTKMTTKLTTEKKGRRHDSLMPLNRHLLEDTNRYLLTR